MWEMSQDQDSQDQLLVQAPSWAASYDKTKLDIWTMWPSILGSIR